MEQKRRPFVGQETGIQSESDQMRALEWGSERVLDSIRQSVQIRNEFREKYGADLADYTLALNNRDTVSEDVVFRGQRMSFEDFTSEYSQLLVSRLDELPEEMRVEWFAEYLNASEKLR